MASSADADRDRAARIRLLERLGLRVDQLHDMAVETREQLVRGDRSALELATSRSEAVLGEIKLLSEEYARLPEARADDPDPELDDARQAVMHSVERLARLNAVNGGLLARLVAINRGRTDLLAAATRPTYRSDGRRPDYTPRGVRLRQKA